MKIQREWREAGPTRALRLPAGPGWQRSPLGHIHPQSPRPRRGGGLPQGGAESPWRPVGRARPGEGPPRPRGGRGCGGGSGSGEVPSRGQARTRLRPAETAPRERPAWKAQARRPAESPEPVGLKKPQGLLFLNPSPPEFPPQLLTRRWGGRAAPSREPKAGRRELRGSRGKAAAPSPGFRSHHPNPRALCPERRWPLPATTLP